MTNKKTHCKNGHKYDEKNSYYDPRGYRRCRICHNLGLKKKKGKKNASN